LEETSNENSETSEVRKAAKSAEYKKRLQEINDDATLTSWDRYRKFLELEAQEEGLDVTSVDISSKIDFQVENFKKQAQNDNVVNLFDIEEERIYLTNLIPFDITDEKGQKLKMHSIEVCYIYSNGAKDNLYYRLPQLRSEKGIRYNLYQGKDLWDIAVNLRKDNETEEAIIRKFDSIRHRIHILMEPYNNIYGRG
jgi:hypothetical protein